MKTIEQHLPSSSFVTRMLENSVFNAHRKTNDLDKSYFAPIVAIAGLLALFLAAGPILQAVDPAAGILDIGILSVLLVGLIGGLAAILCSLWLQELLWQPFKAFRKQFRSHFDQLTSWQQCILYFAVFFLLLYATLWGLAIVF